jgi:hypothetical protein
MFLRMRRRFQGRTTLQGLAPIESAVSTWADARLVPRSGGLLVWYRANEHVLELLAVSRLK